MRRNIHNHNWKTKKWHEQRHILTCQLKHHTKHTKKVREEPNKKTSGPSWYVKRIRYYSVEKVKHNPKELQNLKITALKRGNNDRILNFLLFESESPLNIEIIKMRHFNTNGLIKIPVNFSVIENSTESFSALQELVSAVLLENNVEVSLDYYNCHNVELGTQILLDIILKDFIRFRKWLRRNNKNMLRFFTGNFQGIHIYDHNVSKMSFSVGSPVNLNIKENTYDDVEKSYLYIHDEADPINKNLKSTEETELEITSLSEYVINSLEKAGRTMTDEAIENLYTVIGEALVNAEEHSSTKCRFSIGYFEKEDIDGREVGVFRLAIMNLGRTIYQKFKDTDCPNKKIVERMKQLSDSYTRHQWFHIHKFEEESLWTLYALQDGVSSKIKKRGSGTISIISSFFNIKGNSKRDKLSQMRILSGSTCIDFDGTYDITKKCDAHGDSISVMTFNNTGNIEDKPDSNYVYCVDKFFPGTLISVTLLLDDKDTIEI